MTNMLVETSERFDEFAKLVLQHLDARVEFPGQNPPASHNVPPSILTVPNFRIRKLSQYGERAGSGIFRFADSLRMTKVDFFTNSRNDNRAYASRPLMHIRAGRCLEHFEARPTESFRGRVLLAGTPFEPFQPMVPPASGVLPRALVPPVSIVA